MEMKAIVRLIKDTEYLGVGGLGIRIHIDFMEVFSR